MKRFSIKSDTSLDLLDAFPKYTAIGALANYITSAESNGFQPMKINFGIFPPLSDDDRLKFCVSNRKSEKRLALSKRSLAFMEKIFIKTIDPPM